MKTITLKIRDKKIFPVFSGRLVAQNVKAYRFVLDPDAEWEGLALTATFEGPGGTKSVPLLCGVLEEDIPWEPISASGWLRISVTGLEEAEGNTLRRLQTKEMGEELEIFPNGALPGEESAEHTPEFEERVLALAQEAVVSAENVKLAAENGEFDGADGYSPVRGIDYWTAEDQKVMVEETVAVLTQKPEKKSFADCTWAEIAHIARYCDPSEYWKVGDWKPLKFNKKWAGFGGVDAEFTVPVVIIGFNHDDVADVVTYGKKKAGLTLQLGGNRLITEQMSPWVSGVYEPLKGTLDEILIERQDGNTMGMFKSPNRVMWDGSQYVDATYNVTPEYPNATGTWWPHTGVRHALNSVFIAADRDFLNAVSIVPVEKVTSKYYRPALGNEFYTVTVDKVFLLSETEFWGKQYSSPAIEGEQYEYYRKGASKFFWGDKLLALTPEEIGEGKTYSLWTRSSAQEHLNDIKPTMSFTTRVSNTIYTKDENSASVGYAYGNDKYTGGYYVPAFCL